jgi:hypothetical protein
MKKLGTAFFAIILILLISIPCFADVSNLNFGFGYGSTDIGVEIFGDSASESMNTFTFAGELPVNEKFSIVGNYTFGSNMGIDLSMLDVGWKYLLHSDKSGKLFTLFGYGENTCSIYGLKQTASGVYVGLESIISSPTIELGDSLKYYLAPSSTISEDGYPDLDLGNVSIMSFDIYLKIPVDEMLSIKGGYTSTWVEIYELRESVSSFYIMGMYKF